MTITQLFVLILLVHFVVDFGLQTNEQATKKGEGKSLWNKYLFYHVGVYTLVWSITYFMIPTKNPFFGEWLAFTLAIGVPHYITDWITSRISKKFFSSGDNHNGFIVVGFDQMVHYLCLWWVLTKTIILQ